MKTTRIAGVLTLALGLAACAAVQNFEAKAAPVIQQACTDFHTVEGNPAVNLGATVLDIALPQYGMLLGDVKLAGDTFCATGPAAGSSPDPSAQANWLQGLTALLKGN